VWLSGVEGPFKKEKGLIGRSELLTGALLINGVITGSLLLA